MSDSKGLSTNDVKHLGKLANLPIDEDKISKYKDQLTETLKYIENLSELDTENVEPAHNITGMENIGFEDGAQNSRGFTQDQALVGSKNIKKSSFVVKRIM